VTVRKQRGVPFNAHIARLLKEAREASHGA